MPVLSLVPLHPLECECKTLFRTVVAADVTPPVYSA